MYVYVYIYLYMYMLKWIYVAVFEDIVVGKTTLLLWVLECLVSLLV